MTEMWDDPVVEQICECVLKAAQEKNINWGIFQDFLDLWNNIFNVYDMFTFYDMKQIKV